MLRLPLLISARGYDTHCSPLQGCTHPPALGMHTAVARDVPAARLCLSSAELEVAVTDKILLSRGSEA